MKVLMASSDRSLFRPDGPALLRLLAYANEAGSITVLVTTKRGFKEITPVQNLKIIPTNSLHPLFYVLDLFLKGKKLEKPNLITTQDPFLTGLAGYLLSLFFKVPLEVQAHTDFSCPAFCRESFVNRIRFYIAHFLVHRVKNWRVVSEKMKTFLVSSWKVKSVTVLPIFVSPPKEGGVLSPEVEKKIKEASFAVLMVSRLTKEKQIHLALMAFKKVIVVDPLAILLIAGDGPLRKKLEKESLSLGLSQNVYFLGWVESMGPLYKASNLYLITSSYEGYGMTIVEASSVGLPVLSFDVGIAKEAGATITTPDCLAEDLTKLVLALPKPKEPKNITPYKDEKEYVKKIVDNWRAII